MRRRSLLALLTAAPLAVLAILPNAADAANADRDFVIENATGYTIKALYISPTRKETWGRQLLSSRLKDGESRKIVFKPTNTLKIYDVRAEYADGDKAEWRALDVTTFSTLTIKWNAKTGKSSVVKH